MPKVSKPIRAVQYDEKYTKQYKITIPDEMNVHKGDVYLFERIDEKTIKMTKVI